MKFEFIKEEGPNDKVCYYTKANGRFVDGSLSFEEEKARNSFDFYVRNNTNKSSVETVVETVEIEDEVVTAK